MIRATHPGSADRTDPGRPSYAALLERLAGAGPVEQSRSALVDEAVVLWSRPGFDTLVSLSRLFFTPFPHQLQAAQSALRRMRGRAILADEVGLGKTIEAGLVLSELRLRGLADGSTRRPACRSPPGCRRPSPRHRCRT